MGVGVEGPYFRTESLEETERHKRDLDSAKIAIKNIINDTNKKGLKGLDALLSTFSRISGTGFTIVGEEYLREELKKLDYKLKDVEDLASDQRAYQNIDKTKDLGISISAAINNVVKPGEKIYINSPKPIDYLFLRLKDAEGHVNIAGNCLGRDAINSKIFAKTAGYEAGRRMVNSEMHIYKARERLGIDALGSKIYVYEAGDFLGQGADHSIIFAKKAGIGAGNSIKDSKLFVDKAEEWLADYAENSEIHFGEAGEEALKQIRNCKVYGKKAGDNFGEDAYKSKIYVDELGNNACYRMQDSELHFKKINGKLGSGYVDEALSRNKIYKGKLPYIFVNPALCFMLGKYKAKKLLEKRKEKIKPEPRVSWAELLLYLGPSNKK